MFTRRLTKPLWNTAVSSCKAVHGPGPRRLWSAKRLWADTRAAIVRAGTGMSFVSQNDKRDSHESATAQSQTWCPVITGSPELKMKQIWILHVSRSQVIMVISQQKKKIQK
ncbi:hypothetical protein K435DRAFT_806936 [Dendrothele bispora CBS 962.96]|uniref:Uncharacterized protein n=1 Tax=Dendrothele bispora (strain CBS 962.96) TaxID=1314807 RepID=A0A4S8L6P6_DENBC|nr:hypothetical protein K435DRAFT_806936 [Dendrothele bispora CBS 962.96]